MRLDSTLANFAASRPVTFRVNRLKDSVENVVAELEGKGFLLSAVARLAGAFRIPADQKPVLSRLAAFDEDRIDIQGLSSMTAPRVLDRQPRETVLDPAAAPGDKTLQLAAMRGDQGRVSAVEPVKARFFKLRANLKRVAVSLLSL